jgi:hypothetical protein
LLGEICTDVAAQFSTPYETVLADAIAIVEEMLEMGVGPFTTLSLLVTPTRGAQ